MSKLVAILLMLPGTCWLMPEVGKYCVASSAPGSSCVRLQRPAAPDKRMIAPIARSCRGHTTPPSSSPQLPPEPVKNVALQVACSLSGSTPAERCFSDPGDSGCDRRIARGKRCGWAVRPEVWLTRLTIDMYSKMEVFDGRWANLVLEGVESLHQNQLDLLIDYVKTTFSKQPVHVKLRFSHPRSGVVARFLCKERGFSEWAERCNEDTIWLMRWGQCEKTHLRHFRPVALAYIFGKNHSTGKNECILAQHQGDSYYRALGGILGPGENDSNLVAIREVQEESKMILSGSSCQGRFYTAAVPEVRSEIVNMSEMTSHVVYKVDNIGDVWRHCCVNTNEITRLHKFEVDTIDQYESVCPLAKAVIRLANGHSSVPSTIKCLDGKFRQFVVTNTLPH